MEAKAVKRCRLDRRPRLKREQEKIVTRRRNGIDRLTKASTRHAEEEIRFTATVTGDAEGIELRRSCAMRILHLFYGRSSVFWH
jgi:hypothetical protein